MPRRQRSEATVRGAQRAISAEDDRGQDPPPTGADALHVLYFGTYDRSDGRNTILQEGLRAAGVRVTECFAPLWRDTDAKLAAARWPAEGARTAARAGGAWRRLLAQHRSAGDYDVMLVGSTAHLDLPLARRLAARRGVPLVFDPLVSITETVRDRGIVPAGSLRLRALEAIERVLFRLPDAVLVDSAAHGAAFDHELGVAPERQVVVPAGAPSAFRRLATAYETPSSGARVRVCYFGQFIPLHGLEYVVRAAELLAGRSDIVFDLVGRGQELNAIQSLVAELDLANVRVHPEWLPVVDLAETFVARADICLGVFGDRPKTDRVVPFKVYTALASARAVVTGDTSAVRGLLHPGREVWTVPPADPDALAAAVERLADDPALRSSLSACGQEAFDRRFAAPVLGRGLRQTLLRLGRPGHCPRPVSRQGGPP